MPNLSSYQRAHELFESKDYVEAFALFKEAAKEGNVDALVMIGNMYARAQGVERNYAQAELCFKDACDKGSATGAYNLARMYETGVVMERKRDMTKALRLYTMSAARGDSRAVEKRDSLQARLCIS